MILEIMGNGFGDYLVVEAPMSGLTHDHNSHAMQYGGFGDSHRVEPVKLAHFAVVPQPKHD
ncbi:MAG: hypothetical protein HOM33_05190 [Halieaceae bacterium]|nr:hypothetical protein [Halieaceae bacterium]